MDRIKRPFDRQSRKNRAQAMVEFMLVMPILLALLYGIIEVSRLVFIYSSVSNASRSAARYGAASGENDSGVPNFQDCDGIRETAGQSAFISEFDEINITYDRGVNADGEQIPIGDIDPSPNTDSCPIPVNDVRNGDRIIVQVSTAYEPILPILPLDPFEIVSASARTFLISIPILGSSVPTGFAAETSTPSNTPPPALITPLITSTSTLFAASTLSITYTPLNTIPPVIFATDTRVPPNYTPPSPLPPTLTSTPTQTYTPTNTATVTPTQINCTGLTGVSHGPLVYDEETMEMEIINNSGHTLTTAQIYLEWNHDTGHQTGTDLTLHLRQASLDLISWDGNVHAPSVYLTDFHPTIPPGVSKIRFRFHQTYDNPDGTERILINISTPGCVNYPIDSSH